MKIHTLKIEDKYYNEIIGNNKRCEIRKNDKNYQVGDYIHFVDILGHEFKADVKQGVYSNNLDDKLFIITHVLKYEEGMNDDYVALSIEPVYIISKTEYIILNQLMRKW